MQNIINVPQFFDMKYSEQNGYLTQEALFYNDRLFNVLNQTINNGLVMPSATTTQITAYGNNARIALGTVWFNTNLAKLQVKTAAGTIETITSS